MDLKDANMAAIVVKITLQQRYITNTSFVDQFSLIYTHLVAVDLTNSRNLTKFCIEIGLGLIVLSLLFFGLSLVFMLDRAFLVMANVSTLSSIFPKPASLKF